MDASLQCDLDLDLACRSVAVIEVPTDLVHTDIGVLRKVLMVQQKRILCVDALLRSGYPSDDLEMS